MSLLGMLWRFGSRFRQRRVSNSYGGNDSDTSVATSGIELAAERAGHHGHPCTNMGFIDSEFTDPLPAVTVKPVVFGDGVVFTDGESPGSWIIAEENAYYEWGEL